jgi:dTDP-glucose 4,6-dehydratase
MCNLDLVKQVLAALSRSESLISFVKDRPGHDRRYAIDASKIARDLGWKPRYRFAEALPLTIRWYQEHATWLQRVRSGAYREYYARQYGG